jgi:hypothetical protein
MSLFAQHHGAAGDPSLKAPSSRRRSKAGRVEPGVHRVQQPAGRGGMWWGGLGRVERRSCPPAEQSGGVHTSPHLGGSLGSCTPRVCLG